MPSWGQTMSLGNREEQCQIRYWFCKLQDIDFVSYKMLILQVKSFGGNWIVFDGALH